MNASAAIHDLCGIPRAGPAFRHNDAGERSAPQRDSDARAEIVRNILGRCGITICRLSAATRRDYGSRSQYFIPETFLYKLRSGITPHICQLLALSEHTGYRLSDWLRVCGFDLAQIPHLQMRLHTEHTVLITPVEREFEPFQLQPHYAHEEEWNFFSSSRALSSGAFASRMPWSRAENSCDDSRYLFAKIGAADAMAYPRLRRGSMVRVDRRFTERIRSDQASAGDLLWLVEQPTGLTCCPVRWIDDRHIVLLPNRPSSGQWPLRLPNEARILGLVDQGLVDLGFRPLPPLTIDEADSTMLEQPFPTIYQKEATMKYSDLLRRSRRRTGLTFRAAHRLTRSVAQILGNREYAVALGLLSDYEAMGRLPRHIAKILSLCVVYCMDVWELMEAAGVHVDDSAKLQLLISDGDLPLHSDFLPDVARPRPVERLASYAQTAGR
jgi:hypothetical protein